MKSTALVRIALCAMIASGCVSTGTHRETVDRLEAVQQERTTLAQELVAAQAATEKIQEDLKATREGLDAERQGRQDLAGQIAKLRSEHDQLRRMNDELTRGRNGLQAQAVDLEARVRDLTTKLEAEAGQAATLRETNQRLLAGTTAAREEIAQMRQRVGELEAKAARVTDLEHRLVERDTVIGRLTQVAIDREALADRVGSLSEKSAALEREREQLALALQQQKTRLLEEEAEKARLEQERADKEAEIQRLTRTHDELTKSLEAEIAKGDIRIQQVRDRLTINMVDWVLFNSGQGQVKQAGLKVLKQVSDILKNVHDKQIRIEGHTDNVPIGARLKGRFPTNWELSTARATSVVRYLIEEGGVDAANISAIGYADTRPVANNETEEGRAVNRRIEIVLYPKDLSQIAKQIHP